jgi:hypothetical protein
MPITSKSSVHYSQEQLQSSPDSVSSKASHASHHFRRITQERAFGARQRKSTFGRRFQHSRPSWRGAVWFLLFTRDRVTHIYNSPTGTLDDDRDHNLQYPPDKPGHEMGPTSRFWKIYNEEARIEDVEIEGESRDTLDTLLLFVGPLNCPQLGCHILRRPHCSQPSLQLA